MSKDLNIQGDIQSKERETLSAKLKPDRPIQNID